MAKCGSLKFITKLVLLFNFAFVALSDDLNSDFHAFYFIQQWLPSYCNQKGTKCCYPPTGIPPNFTIDGLWPYNDNGDNLQNCPGATFNGTLLKPIEDMLQKEWPSFTCPQIGKKFWLHEWNKHGTCSKSVLDEMSYFHAALNLQYKIYILEALAKAGVHPNNESYSLRRFSSAISQATGFRPSIYCNHDAQGNCQIWQVIHCVDKRGVNLINCPNYPPKGLGGCGSTIKFPSYY